MSESWQPTMAASAAWRTFPSPHEMALLDEWVRGFLDTDHDYEARLALNVIAQRQWLADESHRQQNVGCEVDGVTAYVDGAPPTELTGRYLVVPLVGVPEKASNE